ARLFQSGLLVSISALACLLARPRLAAVAEIQQHCTVRRIKESLSESETSLSYASDLEAQKKERCRNGRLRRCHPDNRWCNFLHKRSGYARESSVTETGSRLAFGFASRTSGNCTEIRVP